MISDMVMYCDVTPAADSRPDGAVTLRDDALSRLCRTNRRRNLYTSGTSVANGTLRDTCLGRKRGNLGRGEGSMSLRLR